MDFLSMIVSTRTRALFIAFVIGMTAREASAQITMVYDTFTGANGTPLAGHTPDVNLPLANWTIRTNGALVLNGNAALSTQGDGWAWPSWAAIESNTCDGTIAVDWTPGAGLPYGPRSGLIFRMSDANNYWYAGHGMQGTALALWKVVNGSPGLITSASVPNPLGSTHHVEVRLEDSAIEVWWDGTRKIQWSDAFNAWSTMHGVEWTVNEDWASTFDNFTVQTPSYQTVSSVVVTPVGSLTGAGVAQFLTATALNAQGQPIPDALFHWSIDDPTHGELRTVGHYAGSASIGALTGNLTVTAEMLGGPTGSAAITVDATRTMVFDTFTDANGTLLTSHVPTMNAAQAAWAVNATQPMTVQGNQLTSAQTDCPFQPVATLNGSTSDGIVSADWTPAASGPVGGVIVRATNNSNYWFAGYGFGASKLSLYKAVSGSFIQIATIDPGPVLGRSHHIEVRLSGSNIELWWDGALKLQTTDSYSSTATRHGLTWGGCADSTSTFDNFAVQLPARTAPTHVTISPATAALPPGGLQTFTAQAFDAANALIPGTLFHWTISNGVSGQIRSPSYYATSATVLSVTGSETVTATPVAGATGSANVTMDASTTLLFDTFTGTDNVALPAHVPDIDVVGSAWTMYTTAQIGLSGNRARSTQQDSPYLPVALIDASSSEGVVAADWTPAAGLPHGPIGGVVGRASDAHNYWFGGYGYQGTQLALWKMVNGTPGLVVYGSVPNPLGQTHHVELRFNGPVIQLWWDGVLQLQVSDAFNQTGTKYGLVFGAGSDSSSMFDNLSVQGAPSPTVTQVVVTPANPSVALGGLQILTAQALDAQNHVIPNALFHWTINDPSGATLVTPNYFSSSAIVRAVAHDVTVIASMAWGPSASANISADASHVLVYDTFTGSDNTLLTSHAPDVNLGAGVWRTPNGEPIPVLRSSQLVPSAWNETWRMQSTIETNATDVHVGADWTAAAGMPYGPIGGIIFRQRDDQNYWFAGYGWMTYPLALWQVVNGNWVPVTWATVDNPVGGTHHIEVVTSGLNIEVWWDGIRRIQYRSAFVDDGTKVGFKWYPNFDWMSSLDNLAVTGVPRCVTPLSVSRIDAQVTGNGGSLTVTAPGGCTWSAESDQLWITLPSSSSGTGSAALAYAIAENPTFSWRFGSIAIGGRVVAVVQPPATVSCAYGVWPTHNEFNGDGGLGAFDVSTGDSCSWNAAASESWIHITSGSGSGFSTVRFTIDANAGTGSRAGRVVIGDQIFSITQAGAGAAAPSAGPSECFNGVFPSSAAYAGDGGGGTITASAPNGCHWTASSSAPWVTLQTTAGTGSLVLGYTVAANSSSNPRSAVVAVGGSMFTITQDPAGSTGGGTTPPSGNPVAGDGSRLSGLGLAGPMTWGTGTQTVEISPGCTVSVAPTKVMLPASASGGLVSVQATPGCSWSAVPLDPWLVASDGMVGAGSVAVFATETSANRAGRLTVAGVTVTILQHVAAAIAFANGKGPFQRDPETGNVIIDDCEYAQCTAWEADDQTCDGPTVIVDMCLDEEPPPAPSAPCGACSPFRERPGSGIDYRFVDNELGPFPVSPAFRAAFDAAAERWNTHLNTTNVPWRFNSDQTGGTFRIYVDPGIRPGAGASWTSKHIAISPFVNSTTESNAANIRAHGSFHELGHQLGWGDIYNCNYTTSVMVWAAAINRSDNPTDLTPNDLCKFNKDYSVGSGNDDDNADYCEAIVNSPPQRVLLDAGRVDVHVEKAVDRREFSNVPRR